MKSMTTYRILAVWLACFAWIGTTRAQSANSAGEKRAREIAALISTGTRGEMEKYVKENFAPPFRDLPMEQRWEAFLNLRDATRGLEYHSIQDAKPTEVTALFKAKLTGQWIALVVRTEAQEPYRVTGLGRADPRPPAGTTHAEAGE